MPAWDTFKGPHSECKEEHNLTFNFLKDRARRRNNMMVVVTREQSPELLENLDHQEDAFNYSF